ncbi:hypothetical protein GY45DRAFT_513373 [Cubamyces sp. BRFM 1775]|nr:hypothetical protein GY45DRAFT_513373 [Cubamyces sp. BRFM 1775]
MCTVSNSASGQQTTTCRGYQVPRARLSDSGGCKAASEAASGTDKAARDDSQSCKAATKQPTASHRASKLAIELTILIAKHRALETTGKFAVAGASIRGQVEDGLRPGSDVALRERRPSAERRCIVTRGKWGVSVMQPRARTMRGRQVCQRCSAISEISPTLHMSATQVSTSVFLGLNASQMHRSASSLSFKPPMQLGPTSWICIHSAAQMAAPSGKGGERLARREEAC